MSVEDPRADNEKTDHAALLRKFAENYVDGMPFKALVLNAAAKRIEELEAKVAALEARG